MEAYFSYEALQKRIKRLEQSETGAKNKAIWFQQLLDAFPFGIYIVNNKFEIEYTNSLLQKEFGPPNGLKCHKYFHDLETPCDWCKNERVFSGESVIWYWHSEKTNRDYELFDLPLKKDDGSISKIEIFNDITKRRNLASELERFKLAVEQSADGIIITDLTGIITFTNCTTENIYGYNPGELIGSHVRHLNMDGHIPDQFNNPEIKSAGQWTGELVQKRKDGASFDAHMSCTIIRENEKSVAMLVIIRDISELKQKEKALIKSDNLLKETQTLAKIGGWELDVKTGRISWTDEVYRIYGVDPKNYDPDDIAKDMNFYAPQSRQLLKKAFQNALEHGKPYDLELEFTRADKEQIWVRTMGRPEKKDKKVTRISGNFVDITEKKHLEQKQEQALALLEKVYESLDEAVFAVDPENRKIISCNKAAARIFGYDKKEMMGKNTQFLHVSQRTYQEFGKKLARAMAAGIEFHMEFSLKRKDGKIFPTEHTVKAVFDASGTPQIHVSVIRDLTFQKLAEKQLQQHQDELKNRAQRLEELNAALKVLLDQREKEKKDLEAQLTGRLDELILPHLEKLKKTGLSDLQEAHVTILEANIRELTEPIHHNRSCHLLHLTPTETRVADLIKMGYRTKEIASKMGISTRTAEFHRDNIRTKLNIKGRKLNLKTYLSQIS